MPAAPVAEGEPWPEVRVKPKKPPEARIPGSNRPTPSPQASTWFRVTLPKSFIGPARPGAALKSGILLWSFESAVSLPLFCQGGRPLLAGYLVCSFTYSQPSLEYWTALEGATDRADITLMIPVGRVWVPGEIHPPHLSQPPGKPTGSNFQQGN
jgi:hypothetical protein